MTLTPEILKAAAERFGTPFFIYDFAAIERQVERLKNALGDRFTIAYAVKANPSLAVLAFLNRLNLCADVASAGELKAVRKVGFTSQRILSTGPSKTESDLEALVASKVSQIHVEGADELEKLEEIAARKGRRVSIGLRLSPPWGLKETYKIIGGPGSKKFGFDLPSAQRALTNRARFPHLKVTGFQVFNASNVLDADLLVANTNRVLKLALALSQAHDVPLTTVDFGGGLGVPYSDAEKELDLVVLSKGLDEIAQWTRRVPKFRDTRFVFEPGRFLLAQAGRYVVRVIGTKLSRRRRYLLVDGGVHHMARPALIGTPHRVSAVGNEEPPTGKYSIAGPLCTSIDILHPAAPLPEPKKGDLLAFENAGAYGFTESMPLFLSREWAAEAGYLEGELHLLRQNPTAEDLLRKQIIPPSLRP